MQLQASAFVLFCLLPSFGFALPAAASSASKSASKAGASATSKSSSAAAKATGAASNGGGAANNPGAMAGMNTPSDTQIANAVMSWMNDTAKVTKFLNTATSLSGDEFTKQATIALNAEVDELNHKMILDMGLGMMDMVQAANDTLATAGTFQAVVDALQQMVNDGPDTAQSQVTAINNNRCVNVLPNIDMYFAAAGSASIKSARPTGCLEVDPTNPSAVPATVAAANAANGNTAGGNANAQSGDAPSSSSSSSAADGASADASSSTTSSAGKASATKAAGGASGASTSASKAGGAAAASATSASKAGAGAASSATTTAKAGAASASKAGAAGGSGAGGASKSTSSKAAAGSMAGAAKAKPAN
ncbi:hypothetical protein BGZ60DRAFT_423862 [Tricladium varicosporioides]|nr:hypothetical protein BGZ60DRAFT_423862 [Hymenoscyphus varicosporioides]